MITTPKLPRLKIEHSKRTVHVLLNIYNLSPLNGCLSPIGFGVYHSGI